MTGLYDDQGILRFAGRDSDDCLAYAELFGMDPASYSLTSLAQADPGRALEERGLLAFPRLP